MRLFRNSAGNSNGCQYVQGSEFKHQLQNTSEQKYDQACPETRPWGLFYFMCDWNGRKKVGFIFLKRVKEQKPSFKKYIFYLFIFRESGREGEREGEKHQCVVTPRVPLTGGLARNPGMCPDWELIQWSFGSQAGA